MIVISFEDLSKIHRIPKLHGCDFKIEPAMPISNSKWKRAWQTYFSSHTLQIFKINTTFEDLQMILLSFFYILNQISTKQEKPILSD